MHVGVDEPREHSLPVEVDDLGLLTDPSRDIFLRAHRHDPVTLQGYSLGQRVLGVHSHDLPVQEHEICVESFPRH